jgi:uncharacterized protein with HEPN domain
MLEISRRVEKKTQRISRADFLADENLVLAVTHLLQTIGEAARIVSDDTRAQFPAIPWKLITGMRHRIVHDYMSVDEEVVWETATRDVPKLIASLVEVRPSLE